MGIGASGGIVGRLETGKEQSASEEDRASGVKETSYDS